MIFLRGMAKNHLWEGKLGSSSGVVDKEVATARRQICVCCCCYAGRAFTPLAAGLPLHCRTMMHSTDKQWRLLKQAFFYQPMGLNELTKYKIARLPATKGRKLPRHLSKNWKETNDCMEGHGKNQNQRQVHRKRVIRKITANLPTSECIEFLRLFFGPSVGKRRIFRSVVFTAIACPLKKQYVAERHDGDSTPHPESVKHWRLIV